MNAPLHEAARRLRRAYDGTTIAPLRETLDANDVEKAYAIQSINTAFWRQEGRRVVGRKIGLTAAAVQRQLGVDQPDFGVLFDDMQISDAALITTDLVIQPKVEAEVAVILKSDIVEPSTDRSTIIESIDCACAAIEIVDSRIADWKITFADTVADNGSSAFFVLGRERRPIKQLDLYSCGMVMEVDGAIASIGAGAACLGHPFNAVSWLANTLAERDDPLRAGDIILTGALGPMVELKGNHRVRAQIGGLGDVSFEFGEVGS